MRTEALAKIALCTSIVGLFALYFLSENLEPKLISISEVDEKALDEYVKISGQITSAKETEGLHILRIKDASGEIEVVIFKDEDELKFKPGQDVEVIGKISEFRGRQQIEAVEVKGAEERQEEGDVP